MNLLFDTHVVLWASADDPRLPRTAREVTADERVARYEVDVLQV